MNFRNKVLELRTHEHQDKCVTTTIIDYSINQQNARPNSVINRDSSNQYLFKRKVIPGEKTFAETMSSSMTSSNPTVNELILAASNVVIFGDSLVNLNRKTKYNINSSLNNGSANLNIFLE